MERSTPHSSFDLHGTHTPSPLSPTRQNKIRTPLLLSPLLSTISISFPPPLTPSILPHHPHSPSREIHPRHKLPYTSVSPASISCCAGQSHSAGWDLSKLRAYVVQTCDGILACSDATGVIRLRQRPSYYLSSLGTGNFPRVCNRQQQNISAFTTGMQNRVSIC